MNYLFIGLAVLFSNAMISNAGYQYVGCYIAGSNVTGDWHPALRYGQSFPSTPQSCSVDDFMCSNYRYFGIHDGGWCACDYDFDQATKYGVGVGCPANQVGAENLNDLFEHDGQESSYVGCFIDSFKRDALPDGPRADGYTKQECSDSCLTYKFFALQAGRNTTGWCCCGNDWTSASQYGEDPNGCPSTQVGARRRNDIFMHDALVDDGEIQSPSVLLKKINNNAFMIKVVGVLILMNVVLSIFAICCRSKGKDYDIGYIVQPSRSRKHNRVQPDSSDDEENVKFNQ